MDRALAMPAAMNHRQLDMVPTTERPSRRCATSELPSETVLPMKTAKDGLGTSPRPILVTAWPVARINAAPNGRMSAQSGQSRLRPFGFQAATMAPTMTASVPSAIGHVSFSPMMRMAQSAPNSGAEAVSALESVGPMCWMLDSASAEDSAGRKMPTRAKSRHANVAQYQLSMKNGAKSQYTTAEAAIETMVPVRASDWARPKFEKWFDSANRNADASA